MTLKLNSDEANNNHKQLRDGEYEEIMKAVINDTKCDTYNYEWTSWNSVQSPSDLENDYELLIDHQRLFRLFSANQI